MALIGVFIGVNKHSDPGIPELTGATKDARALWALFKDSVEGIVDRRLLDEEATAAAIRTALDASLRAATPDDTVVIYFAGHGTPGHQLVPFDTDLRSVGQTTIPMQEIADRLKSTKARASLVILDCCFSGGAPARVLEGVPVARAAAPSATDLGGNGRLVLAAAQDDQEALELGQHGLFTGAVLRVLQDGLGWTDIGVLMDEVTRHVRAEAARTGHQQTPVWAGIVVGGIELPPMHAGRIFAAEFPDTATIRIRPQIAELSAFAVPQPVLDAWSARFPDLNNLQLSAVNDYRVLDGQALLVTAPTTSGKTFIGEMAGARAIADGRKAVFLLPFKALANEKFEEFEELYGRGLGLRVLRCTGDYADQTEPFVKGQYDLAVLTYEMFLGLSVAMPNLLSKIGLVVLDEAQFVTDRDRGIGVELLLTNLLTARERGVQPQIVALSAVIGDVNHFDEWLGCQTLATTERPVPLVEGVLDRSGNYQYLDVDGKEQTEQLLDPRDIVQRKQDPSSQDIIVPLVRRLVGGGEQVLIFRNKKGPSSGCANYLAEDLGLPPAAEVLEALPDQDLSAASTALHRALRGGYCVPHERPLSRGAGRRRTCLPGTRRTDSSYCGHVDRGRGRKHAGRDGHHCGDRVLRSTARALFRRGIQEHGWPSRPAWLGSARPQHPPRRRRHRTRAPFRVLRQGPAGADPIVLRYARARHLDSAASHSGHGGCRVIRSRRCLRTPTPVTYPHALQPLGSPKSAVRWRIWFARCWRLDSWKRRWDASACPYSAPLAAGLTSSFVRQCDWSSSFVGATTEHSRLVSCLH